MVGILVFANWARSGDVRAIFLCCPGGLSTYEVQGKVIDESEETVTIIDTDGTEHQIPAELMKDVQDIRKNSLYESIHRYRWGFAKQILPLLLLGVLVAGLLLGRPGPGNEGVIPTAWVNAAVGGNSIWANLFAAIAGAFMYFATLTEVPILQGLLGAGMGKGPALALLLAGPALSLPNMLVIRSVMGTQKTAVFVLLVILMATISGIIFGAFF